MCKPSTNKSSTTSVAPNPISKSSGLNILSFNVENLQPKLDEPTFIDLIYKHDICILCETWNKDDSKIGLPGYWDFSQIQPKNKKAGRYSRGISILAKDSLRAGIKVVHNSEGFIWLKLDKNFFNLGNDLYICAAYIPPQT